MQGVPPSAFVNPFAGHAAPAATAAPAAPAAPAAEGASTSPLAALRSHPRIDEFRELVQTHPGQMMQVIQQITAEDPELANAIVVNQDEFLSILSEPVGGVGEDEDEEGEEDEEMDEEEITGEALNAALTPEERRHLAQQLGITEEQLQMVLSNPGALLDPEDQGDAAQEVTTITLTPEEQEAVNRVSIPNRYYVAIVASTVVP